jgi:hypothetical protein
MAGFAGVLALVPLGIASTASAATMTSVRLEPPTAISYQNRQTTIAGTLVSYTSSGYQGIGGEQLTLGLYADDRTTMLADLGSVTTAADGGFSLTTTVPGPGFLRATFAGDDTYARSLSQTTVNVNPRLSSRVLLDPLPAVVDPNTDFTISGQVQEQTPDGSWEPANWALVELARSNQRTYLGPDGRFSFTVQESAPTDWQIYAEPDASSFNAATASPNEFVDVPPQQTRITSLTVHSNGLAQQGLTLTVHADMQAGGGWKPYTGRLLLFFRPKGSADWQTIPTDPSWSSVDAGGDQVFPNIPSPYLWIPPASGTGFGSRVAEDGSWRAEVERVTSAPGRTGVTASESGEVPTVMQKYGTSVVDKRIVYSGGSHYLRAELWEPLITGPGSIGMVPRQPVKVYFRYSGGTAWHYVTTTSTDGNGRLSAKLTLTHRYYRLVYGGSAQYAGTTSGQIYFSS